MTYLSFAPKIIFKEGAWSAFGKIMTALGTLIGVRLLTEFVSKEIYGKISLLIGIATLGSNLCASPLISAAQRFHPEMALSGSVFQLRRTIVGILKWTVGILVSLILLVGLFVQSDTMSYPAFVVLAAFIVVQVMRNLEVGFLTAARRQKETAIWDTMEAWAKPVIAVLLVILLGAKPQSVLLGYFIAVGAILLCFNLLPIQAEGKDLPKKHGELDSKLLSNIRSYAIPLIPLAIVGWTISLSDRYIIGGILGMEDVGIYAASYGLISMPFLITSSAVSQALRPIYFQSVSTHNKSLETKMFRIWFTAISLLCLFGVIAVYYFRHWIAVCLLAREYRTGTLLMPWIAAGIGFQVISQIFENILFAYKRTGFVLFVHSIGAIVCVVSVVCLIDQFGLVGAAVACPVYYSSMLLISMILIRLTKKTG
ncbi:MAG: oligosaccharide flippase family protein [Planctomycetes bacterium]|nr:oligosaccharide flippase family protein [Planctomycetota bacterium]